MGQSLPELGRPSRAADEVEKRAKAVAGDLLHL